jgi:urease subunit alpha
VDLIAIVREPNVICSSTTPTIPWGVSAADETLAMTVLNHGAAWAVADDVALILERLHPATMAAEGRLHELGAIAIVNSDSQGMGRIMETFRRTIQLAHAMKAWRASEAGSGHPGLPAGDAGHDNARVLRYLAKVTIEPAITRHFCHVGSFAPGRLADAPHPLAAQPLRSQAGVIAQGRPRLKPLGENARLPWAREPTRYAPDWAGYRPRGAFGGCDICFSIGRCRAPLRAVQGQTFL